MEFFGIGLPELVVILVLTLIVVGPQRLPEVAAQVGRTIREFRRYSSGITKELLDAVQDLEKDYQELRGELKSVSGELRNKAETFGKELTDVAGEVREKLQIEEAAPKAPPEAAAPGDNGSGGEVPATPALQAKIEESAD